MVFFKIIVSCYHNLR